MRLSIYNYTCFHIRGTENIWANMLDRWSALPTVRRFVNIPQLSESSSPRFAWQTLQEIPELQQKPAVSRPTHLAMVEGLWKNPTSATCVPDNGSDMQLHLCFVAHNEPRGHRGQNYNEANTASMVVLENPHFGHLLLYSCLHSLPLNRRRYQNSSCFWTSCTWYRVKLFVTV